MAVLGAMLVAVIMLVIMVMVVVMAVIVSMVVPAAAGGTFGMRVVVTGVIVPGMFVAMPMIMGVSVVMAVIVAGMVAVAVVVMIIGAALGLERARHLDHGAALTADHLGQNMVVLDINRIGRDLGRGVPVADVPGDAHQAQRVLGADFQQVLGGGLDLDEAAILELDGIAVAQCGRLVQVEQDVEPAIALERQPAAIAVLVVERQRLDDLVRLDRGLANNGGGTQHDVQTRDDGGSKAIDGSRLHHFHHRRGLGASPRDGEKSEQVRLLHVPVDVEAGFPALERYELSGFRQAFVDVIGKTAMFAACCRNALSRGSDKLGASAGADFRARNHDDRIGHAALGSRIC